MTVTVTYCTEDDVRRVMQTDLTFGTGDTPSQDDVRMIIQGAEDEIDKACNRAWREVTITNRFYDLTGITSRNIDFRNGVRINLGYKYIKQITSGSGDKIEVWNGSSYVDYAATKTEGRGNDYWLNYESGILYLREFLPLFEEDALRMTFRYGETTVPPAVREACALLAAAELITTDDESQLMSESGSPYQMTVEQKAVKWRARAWAKLKNYIEVWSV